jgi:hypothetical protein
MFVLLDIDGVMVSGASWKRIEILSDGFSTFSSKAVSALQKIIAETGASIVLTTSHKSSFSIPQWEKIFKSRGINAGISRLDENKKSLGRKDEILSWLKSRSINDDYVIIDDDKSLNALPIEIKKRFVLTDSIVGLDIDSASKAIDVLKSSQLELV